MLLGFSFVGMWEIVDSLLWFMGYLFPMGNFVALTWAALYWGEFSNSNPVTQENPKFDEVLYS